MRYVHSYVHDQSDPDRYRIDGQVRIGHNVYICSASFITAGVTIVDSVIMGTLKLLRLACWSRFYVSAGLRKLNYSSSPYEQSDLILVKYE